MSIKRTTTTTTIHSTSLNPGSSSALSADQEKKRGGRSRKYLIGYNLASASAWSIVLSRLLFNSLLPKNIQAHQSFNKLLLLVQSTALLEILHASLGLVRAALLTTVMQVASRLTLVWIVLPVFPHASLSFFTSYYTYESDAQSTSEMDYKQTAFSPIYASMVLAWSLSEILRCATYASSLLHYPVRPLLWLRYSAFYFLYPLGAASEWGLIFLAYRASREADGASMGGLSYLMMTALTIWPPALLMMMRHMSKQRKKFIRAQYPLISSPQK